MHLTPYLSFDGNCLEAFQFYERCLGGKIIYKMTYGEMPGQHGSAPERIAHISFSAGNQTLNGADSTAEQYSKPRGFSIAISVTEPAEADRIFGELAPGGSVQMPIQETFWAQRFGMVTDRFGTPWMVNCEKPRQTPHQ